MKNKNEKTMTDELETDDEVLREEAMRDREKLRSKWKLRPCVPGTISIMRSNLLDKRDELWFVAAFAFVHSAPIDEVLAVDSDKNAFNLAVRHWQLTNIADMTEQGILSEIVGESWARVDAAETTAKNPNPTGESSGK